MGLTDKLTVKEGKDRFGVSIVWPDIGENSDSLNRE